MLNKNCDVYEEEQLLNERKNRKEQCLTFLPVLILEDDYTKQT